MTIYVVDDLLATLFNNYISIFSRDRHYGEMSNFLLIGTVKVDLIFNG